MSLSARDLEFAYGRTAGGEAAFRLHRTTLSFPRGAITGLIGPNGCGKTTLLKLLAGLRTPRSGGVALDGEPLARLGRRDIARRIAFVPQDTQPAYAFTVLELVLMGRHPHLGPLGVESARDVTIAMDALEATSSRHLAARTFDSLSGGERQRVVIAGALAQAPEVLLLDEPTAALDIGHQIEIAEVLLDLRETRGVTMVVATHDLAFAARLCDHLVLLRDGEVVAHGPTGEVLTAAHVRRLYDVEADVALHPVAGRLTVVPIARLPQGRA